MANFQGDGKAIFKVFIGAIIALAIIGIVATAVIGQTSTSSSNQNVTAPAVNATLDVTGRELITSTVVSEAGNASNISVGMFLQTATGSNGLRTIQLTLNDTASQFAATTVNLQYTFNPDGYLSNAGARAINLLIIIFAALAIMIYVIVIFIQSGSLGKLIGRS